MENLKTRLRLLKARVTYAYAKFKAVQRNRFTGKRQFIVTGDDGRLLVMDRDVFYRLRRRKVMPQHIKPHMLGKISVWYTAGTYQGKPSPPMSRKLAEYKRRRYLRYVRNLK